MNNKLHFSSALSIVLLFALTACDDHSDSDGYSEPKQQADAPRIEHREGKRLIRLYCLNCHGIAGKTRDQLHGPSLWAVRESYLKAYPDEASFVVAMVDFLSDPKLEKSKMPESVKRHGLMAPILLEERSLQDVSRAIYEGAVNRPAWWRSYAEEGY
jgi:hypothetical protein